MSNPLSLHSPESNKIYNFLERKYYKQIAIIGLLKCCALISAQFKSNPRFHLLLVAPTGQFKSRTNIEAQNFFSPTMWINLGSDFTVHGIMKQYPLKKGKHSIHKKCMLINDGTLLLASKAKRTKDRLINAFAELLSEGEYIYIDWQGDQYLKGDVSLIMNMTNESYEQNKKYLFECTFLERMLTVFFEQDEEEYTNYSKKRHDIRGITIDEKKINKIKEFEANMDMKKYYDRIKCVTDDWSILNYKDRNRTMDVVEGLLKSHACLNGRSSIVDDDFEFLNMVRPFLIDKLAPNQHHILKMHLMGKNNLEIAKELRPNVVLDKNKDHPYRAYVSRVVKTAINRGIIFRKKVSIENDKNVKD